MVFCADSLYERRTKNNVLRNTHKVIVTDELFLSLPSTPKGKHTIAKYGLIYRKQTVVNLSKHILTVVEN